MFVKYDLQYETSAGLVYDSGLFHHGFVEEGVLINVQRDRAAAEHGNKFTVIALVTPDFHVDGKGSILMLKLAGLGSTSKSQERQKNQPQIDVEPNPTNYHSGLHEIGTTKRSKDLMSKQYNKAEKRKRRLAYLKRKKGRVKAMKAGKA